ncbi:metalloregulator ArsR/SmtB family transcription factor [Bacillus sp. 31A1R]|uniref:Metalloregulator ArsR/SmtB family transcription factor n=1 Tax=Robertmurraya mangrovi TaxID=3098077 RepID=A0ABU5ISM1_9BACI|nr:metalloregulator ArsR/SmtB family transcription factor [Bacillus sp. 31A1R]MDZ5470149.1 metalloregulator ArsR/SmtB family transcription factor [Bacillus sp. 31A1R]
MLLNKEICEVNIIDERKVKKVIDELKHKNTKEVATLFKALSDNTRVKIAYSLTIEEPLCVCDVANIVGCSIATASHHLRLLRNLGLAKYKKEGKLVYYYLDDDHVKQLVEIAFTHQKEVELRGTRVE